MATSRICSIPDCDKPRDSHGYCGAHAQRFRRHGDPLGGGTSHGEPLNYFRNVVLAYAGDECLIWPYAKDMQGYAKMHVGDENCLVHRLVCKEENGPAPTSEHEAAHSCGRGTDACVTRKHLSWKTHLDNEADKLTHGTSQHGERNHQAKITEDIVRQIRAMKGKKTQREISEVFGVVQATVSHIHTRKTWALLD